ncbi:Retrovirus-related Pol polyprotein from transposon [Ceratobasidium sp. AG-Ba]|nr:Retrovirus-related Pol polyprotein from transposon [Ceratobasidium sp. AG-Ba]QRW07667.1 Retrovirus-related Pol polyprotein from transposon [Ceratobasidium sp. AG-Ba]
MLSHLLISATSACPPCHNSSSHQTRLSRLLPRQIATTPIRLPVSFFHPRVNRLQPEGIRVRYPIPESPAADTGYLPGADSDEDRHPDPDSPRTPRRPRRRHSLFATAPFTARHPTTSSDDKQERESNLDSPTVVRSGARPVTSPSPVVPTVPVVSPAPPPQANASTSPTGPQTPPSLGSAAASVLVGPMSVRDALVQILSLCGGQFYDEGRPKPEVEYRRNFISATIGLSDEQIASLWISNLVYDSPAYDWYDDLIQTAEGRTALEKWSTLQPEIEKRWPTPARDRKATKRRHWARWREHTFNIQEMLVALADDSASTKPHQAWAQQHKALGAALGTMSDEEKVLQTLEGLPVFVVELLPKKDQYSDDWSGLIKDIGDISSRLLLHRYNQESMIDSMFAVSLSGEPQPQPSPAHRRTQASHTPSQPAVATPARRTSNLRFDSTPQVAPEPASAPPAPNTLTRPQTQYQRAREPTPRSRDPAPHLAQASSTPLMPGPLTSVLSRATALAQPPPVGAQRIPDTPSNKAKWSVEVQAWKVANFKQPHSLKRPFPLRPGTYEQTADSCTMCGMADHYSYQCEAEGPDVLDDKEQGYRRLVARKLRDERRAGTQPSTPSPAQRYRDTAQVEFGEPDFDPESDLGSGNE